MVNTMDLGRGFLKLQEDSNSRRSSSLFRQKPLELNENGLHYVTRINCGCGQCVPFRVKVERDDGGLRIGKLTLATNCHLIIVIFGFFFLIAGSVLTALAYNEPSYDPDLPVHARASTEHMDSPSRQEGKVAGPIFIFVGSCLILIGFTLTALACKLNREAKRQLQLSRFTWETPPIQTPDIFNNSTASHYHSVSSPGPDHYATFSTNNLDTFSVRSRELSTGSVGSGDVGGRKDSSFTFHRQKQNPPPPLSTIAQAVPVGIFLFGSGDQSVTSPRSPTIQVTDPSGFQEIELGSPTTESAPPSASAFSSRGTTLADSQHQQYYYNYSRKQRSQSDGTSLENVSTTRLGSLGGDSDSRASRGGIGGTDRNLNPNDDPSGGQQNKVNLGLRPSLPIIPMFATSSPHYFSRVVTPLDARNLYVSSRSDEPFGSIASLSTSGDIACFPVTSSSSSNTTTNNGNSGGAGTATHGSNNISMQPTPECEEDLSTATSSTSSSSVVTAPRILSGGCANSNTKSISSKKNTNENCSDMERNRINNYCESSIATATADDDKFANNSTAASSISTSSNSNRKGISELPPINVNDNESKSGNSGGAAVGLGPKSILRQSKSEDWQDEKGKQDTTGNSEEKQ